MREDLLVSDEIVKAVLAGHPPEMSLRTVNDPTRKRGGMLPQFMWSSLSSLSS